MKPSKKAVSAKVFDEAFDQGKDITPYLDLRTAKVRQPTHRINWVLPEHLSSKSGSRSAWKKQAEALARVGAVYVIDKSKIKP